MCEQTFNPIDKINQGSNTQCSSRHMTETANQTPFVDTRHHSIAPETPNIDNESRSIKQSIKEARIEMKRRQKVHSNLEKSDSQMRSRSMCVSQAKKREGENLRTLEREEMSTTFFCFLDNNRTLNDAKNWFRTIHMTDSLDV